MTDHPHEFETFEGASGFACTAMVMRDDAGTDCGLPASAAVHGHWSPAKDCNVEHLFGEEGWRPTTDGGHEHWVSPLNLPTAFLEHFGIEGEFVIDHSIAARDRRPLGNDPASLPQDWAFGEHSAAYLIAATSWPWEQEEARLNWCDKLATDETLRRQEYNRAKENLDKAFGYLEGGG